MFYLPITFIPVLQILFQRNIQWILEKGTVAFYNADHNECIIAFKAGNVPKVVYMLSTCHNPAIIETGKSNLEANPVMKPTMVSSYNTHKGGADRVNQQLHNIQSLRKSYKWYKKLTLRLVMQVMLNAHKVYQIHIANDNMMHLHFLHDNCFIVSCYTRYTNSNCRQWWYTAKVIWETPSVCSTASTRYH